MDVSDITKVASRKRMSEDAEKLREKISRETAKIIKLKVAQDTAYWDLKEKLQQVEANHERLQQNMVEVQMQHETISGQYQDELRLRPEILNKLGGTRSICDVLEEYGARLRATVARAHADRTALAASSRAAAERVQRLRTLAEHALAQHQQHAHTLQQKLKMSGERYAACTREAIVAREAAEAAAAEARARLDAETVRRERAQNDLERLTAQLRRSTADLDRKDRVISEMQKESQRVITDLQTRIDALEQTVTDQRKELESRAVAEEQARRDGEETAARNKAECEEMRIQLHRLHQELTEMEERVVNLNQTVANLSESNEQLTNDLRDKEQMLEQRSAEIKDLEAKSSALELEKGSLASQLAVLDEAHAKSEAECNRIREELRDLQTQEQQLREQFSQYKAESDKTVADKESQLKAASDTITRLMRDVQVEADATHRLEVAVKNKDEELSRNLTVIVDLKNENERLRTKVASEQATIENIQKELAGRVAASSKVASGMASGERRQKPERLRPEPTPIDTMLYNFLSDTSNDADVLEVKNTSPLSLSQVKRNLHAKSRTFFKSKKCEKPKKIK